jgi:O-antigen ligase
MMGFYGTLITQSRLASLLFILLTIVQLAFAMGKVAFSRRIVLPLLGALLLGGVAAIFTISDIQAVGDYVMKYDGVVLSMQDKAQDFWDFLNLSKQSPLFGFGPGTFEVANLASISSETVGHRWDYRSAHSILLGNALELGWPHVALELIFLVYCAQTIARARAKALWNDRMRALGLALVCVAISGWVDIALDVPAVAAFSAWLLGLMVGKALSLKPHDFQPLAGKDGTIVVTE